MVTQVFEGTFAEAQQWFSELDVDPETWIRVTIETLDEDDNENLNPPT